MAQTLTVSASGGSSISAGATSWSNPGNITASDDSRATVNLSSFSALSDILKALFSGLSAIPATARIDGLELNIEQSESTTQAVDFTVQFHDGTGGTPDYIGSNKSTAANIPASDTVATFGSPTDQWSISPTPSLLQGANLGMAYRALRTSGSPQVRIDHEELVVYYEVPAVKSHCYRMMRA